MEWSQPLKKALVGGLKITKKSCSSGLPDSIKPMPTYVKTEFWFLATELLATNKQDQLSLVKTTLEKPMRKDFRENVKSILVTQKIFKLFKYSIFKLFCILQFYNFMFRAKKCAINGPTDQIFASISMTLNLRDQKHSKPVSQ